MSYEDACVLPVGEKAYLQYEREPDNVLDLQHTVVPEAFRGKGVAKILAKVRKIGLFTRPHQLKFIGSLK